MKKQIRLPERVIKLWKIRVSVLNLLVCVILLKLSYLSLYFLIPLILVLLLTCIEIFWYIPKYLGDYRIEISEKALTVKSGVFFKQIYIMPYPRMIYIYTVSSPVANKLGLSAAVIKAARGNLFTPEMSNTDINELLKLTAGEKNEN